MSELQLEQIEQFLAERDLRIAALEARLEDQEHSLRHILTMLIEWMEAENARKAA